MNTVAAIDRILTEGRKSSTYKLAVLRALVDLVIERPGQESRNGFHLVPVVEIARRVLGYYWKPALEGVPQGTQNPTIPTLILGLGNLVVGDRGRIVDHPDQGAWLADWIEGTPELPGQLRAALLGVRYSLLKYPLKHLPNVGDRRAEVFNLVTMPAEGHPGLPMDASYDDHRRAAPNKRAFRAATTWRVMLDCERTFVVLSARAYEEISEFRFWLRDAILMRWLQECERFGATGVGASLLAMEVPERDRTAADKAHRIIEAADWQHCLYTGTRLGKGIRVQIDHVLPFSRFPVDLFWNLAPTSASANLEKSDRLPKFTPAVQERYFDYLGACIAGGGEDVAVDLDWTWRKYFQRSGFAPLESTKLVGSIWTVVDRAWSRLERSGVGVWAPLDDA